MPLYLKLLQQALTAEVAALTQVILVLLVIGVATAIFQAALQIEDPTLALLLKTLAMIGMILFGGLSFMTGFEVLAAFWIGHAPAIIRMSWS